MNPMCGMNDLATKDDRKSSYANNVNRSRGQLLRLMIAAADVPEFQIHDFPSYSALKIQKAGENQFNEIEPKTNSGNKCG